MSGPFDSEREVNIWTEGLQGNEGVTPTRWIVAKDVEFSVFDDLTNNDKRNFLSYRHSSAVIFRFTTEWENDISSVFLKSHDMGFADRLFRNLAPQKLVNLDYFILLGRRCRTAENLAKRLIDHGMPKKRPCEPFRPAWFVPDPWETDDVRPPRALLLDKLKCCALLHYYFFESLLDRLAHYTALEIGSSLQRPPFRQIEASVWSRFTPHESYCVLGLNDWLFEIVQYDNDRSFRPRRPGLPINQAQSGDDFCVFRQNIKLETVEGLYSVAQRKSIAFDLWRPARIPRPISSPMDIMVDRTASRTYRKGIFPISC